MGIWAFGANRKIDSLENILPPGPEGALDARFSKTVAPGIRRGGVAQFAPGFWLVRAGRPLLHLSGSVFAYTYKMLASAALQRRILATSWHRCTG